MGHAWVMEDEDASDPLSPRSLPLLALLRLGDGAEHREQELHLHLRLSSEWNQHRAEDVRGASRRLHHAHRMSSCHQASEALLQAKR